METIFTCRFTVYCKGVPGDIGAFKKRVAGAGIPREDMFRFKRDVAINDSPVSLRFDLHVHPLVWEQQGERDIQDDFIPLMKHFTQETGQPLEFFFDLAAAGYDTDDWEHEQYCGFRYFKGGALIDSRDWFFTAADFRYTDEHSERSIAEAQELLNAALTRTHEAEVAERRRTWLYDFERLETCLAAVTQDGLALKHVPEPLKTPELCRASVKQNSDALRFVPEPLKTIALMKAAGCGYITRKEALAAVQEEGVWLSLVAWERRTAEVCRAAVHNDPNALNFVPDDLKTPALCLLAVERSVEGWAFENVPETLQHDPDFCLTAVTKEPGSLHYIPEELRTAEFSQAVVNAQGLALEYVPEDKRTPALCVAAVQQNGNALEYVPAALRTTEVCLIALQQNGWMLQFVPAARMTPELCLVAVQEDGNALEYVPAALKTPALCMTAVEQDSWALEYVPEALKTPDLCLAAVTQDGFVLRYVPEAQRTLELCLAAVRNWDNAREYVPEALKAQVQAALN